jgi:hypothetical protein
VWATRPWPGVKFDGIIHWEDPYDADGKLKPKHTCNIISEDDCVEKCVIRKGLEATKNPPKYKLGWAQCDMWANDQIRDCRKECNAN